MKSLANQLKWQFILLTKNNIIGITIAVTIIYGLVFFAIKDLGNADKLLTLIIYNDTAIIGLFFIGISVIMEKNQQILPALFVTPINLHHYLLSRIISLSILGWLCTLTMAFVAMGNNFHIFHFSAGVLGICVLCCLAGLYVVSYTTEVLLFLLKTVPFLLFIVVPPLFNYYEVTDIALFYLLPVQGSLNLIANASLEQPVQSELIYGYVTTFCWSILLYWFIFKIFKAKIVNQ
ncbi:MAG: hypothetical protein AAGI07_20195 [Bacteroidota bacterium]